jgi:predicted dithiol-disulfide oxidoreductase (DUF899 family)
MNDEHTIVSREEWLAARKRLLTREKEFTRLKDELNQQRRSLPWERVDKNYKFQTESGTKTLAELFGNKSHLAVYHFMFAPSWEAACKSCSFWADNFNGITPHLAQRDIRLVAISRAPLSKLTLFAKRMGWSFPWVSSSETDFNFDYQVSFRPEDLAAGETAYNFGTSDDADEELPGISMFYKDESGALFHTYSCFARGIEIVNGAYQWIDLAPKGRGDEAELAHPMAWLRFRDEYPR